MRLLLFVLIALAGSLWAQEDSAVVFRIQLANGQTRFHVGETIPVEMAFSSTVPNAYKIDTRSYDRSGRLNSEVFHVSPEGRDPLREYFAHGPFLFGGLSSGPVNLTLEPRIIREDLNEWLALDKPGHYSLSVTTYRVGPRERTSNTVEFDVVAADPLWEREVLRSGATDRTLRFLDTENSIRESVRRLGTSWDLMAGLIGTAHRDFARKELERQMSEPDVAITGDYISALVRLQSRGDADDKNWLERSDALYRKAAEFVRAKQGLARAETVRAILSRPGRQGEMEPVTELPGEEVAAAFEALPPDQQETMLGSFSARIKIPAMIAPLKKLAAQAGDPNQPMLTDAVLRTLYDIDPAEGRRAILEEIRHPHADHGMIATRARTLSVLPEKTLAQFDDVLAARLEQKDSRTTDLDAQLLGRYATEAVLARVKTAYEEGSADWDCAAQDGWLSYFLRTDVNYGVKKIRKRAGFCLTESLEALVRMGRWGDVEQSVIHNLNGRDLNAGRDAADTLAKYGSLKAKAAMWARAQRFHDEWTGDEAEFESEAQGFQYGLMEGLGRARTWVLSNQEVEDLEKLTVGQEKENVGRWRVEQPVDLQVNFGMGPEFHATVHQYVVSDAESLRRKLSQYPMGTRFALTTRGTREQLEPVMRALSGFIIEIAPVP